MIDYCNRLPFTVSLQNTRSQTRNYLNLLFVSIEGFPIFHMFPCVWNIRHHPSLQPFTFVNTWSHAVWGHQASRCLEDGVLGEGTAMLGALVVWLHHGGENGEPLWTRLQLTFPTWIIWQVVWEPYGRGRYGFKLIKLIASPGGWWNLCDISLDSLENWMSMFRFDVHLSPSPLSTDSGQRWSWVIRNHIMLSRISWNALHSYEITHPKSLI